MIFTGHLTIFCYNFFFYNDSNHEIAMSIDKTYPCISGKQVSACGSLYFWSYTPWKIGFVASPETSQKHVFRVKMS
jgi:hypothetical protein